MADRLLRYTDLGMADVSNHVGFGSANNIYLTYMRDFSVTHGERRQKIRKQGDMGRYKL